MPKVSIIIPNYNNAHYVGEAIQSALNQTFRSFEIIVVDDGSTDNSRETIVRFNDKVRYIWQANQGLGGARNTGILAAKGEFIGLLDADDRWGPRFLETMISLADQYPEAAVYYCSAQAMDVDGHDLPQVYGGPVIPPETTYYSLLRANFLIPSTIIMRRLITIKAGLFEQSIRAIHGCEDWDLWLRIASEYNFVGTAACLVRYRIHASSLSANSARMQQAARAVIEKHFGLDDGQWSSWAAEKRRAYGGVYRHHLLISIQRQHDWSAGAQYLRLALQVDPPLAIDLTLFYDLALGIQPSGYRGTSFQLGMKTNANSVSRLLTDVFAPPVASKLEILRRQTYGTAYYALGLVAYNTGELRFSRHLLSIGLRFRPDLWHDPQVVSTLLKTYVGRVVINRLRCVRRMLRNMVKA